MNNSTVATATPKNTLDKWVKEDINFGKFFSKYSKLKLYLEANDGQYPDVNTDKQLFQWVKNIRQFYKRGSIEQRRIDLLDQIKFEWKGGKRIFSFDERVIQLLAYKKKKGSMHVPQKTRWVDGEEYSLSRWVNEMRRKYNEDRLPFDYIKKLNKINFIWNMEDVKFERRLNALKRFHKEYNHFDVPQKGRYKKLGNWVASIRSRGIVTDKYKLWLDQIGFVWDGVRARKRLSIEKMVEVDMKTSLKKIRSKNKRSRS